MEKSYSFSYQNCLIRKAKIEQVAKRLLPTIDRLNRLKDSHDYSAAEASINLLDDKILLAEVKTLAKKKVKKDLKYVLVIGIGGSNLGTKAIYDALRGPLDHLTDRQPKMIFLDTVSEDLLISISKILSEVKNKEEILISVISKSGKTTETIANFEAIRAVLEKRWKKIDEQVVVITDDGSALFKAAAKRQIDILTVPENVGGRFSVFSAVGLFPLILGGVKINRLLSGAEDMRRDCLQPSVSDNPALSSAVSIYLQEKKGILIHNTFLFAPQLESIGKWYRQLVGESLGKEKNQNNKTVRHGITPLVSIGSTDLHSMAQLYFGGPRDKLTTFISINRKSDKVKVPLRPHLGNLVPGIAGKSHQQIMQAIISGVKKAYKKNKLPYMEMELAELSEHALGRILQWKMMEVIFLASLNNLNAFDQPNVEDYKKETRRLLR